MDISSPTPFVNRDQLGRFVQRKVRLVGSVESMDNDTTIRVKAADEGLVTIRLRAPSSFDDKFICVEGLVESPDTIVEDGHSNFGNSFDVQKHNELCKLVNGDFQQLFG